MRKMIVLALCAGVSGCVSTPKGNVTPISAVDIFRKLGCEIYAETKKNPAIVDDGWAITADVKFTSAVGGGIGANATGKDTISNGSFAFASPLGFSRGIDRVYTQKIAIFADRLSDADCKEDHAKALGGSLGIAEIFAEYRSTQKGPWSGPQGWLQSVTKDSNDFAGSTTFTVTRSLKDWGPTWTLTHVTASLGLSASEANTNQISISVVIPKTQPRIVTSTKTGPKRQTPTPGGVQLRQPVRPSQSELFDRSLQNLELFIYREDKDL